MWLRPKDFRVYRIDDRARPDEAGSLEEAAKVLQHDPGAYPPPWNQLDALARQYEKRSNVEQAIHYYTLSLQENSRNEWAKKRLAELSHNPAPPAARRPQ